MVINCGRQEQADFNGETGPAWSWNFLLSEDQIATLPQPERDLYLGPALRARSFPNIEIRGCQFRLHKLDRTRKTQNSGIVVTEDSVDKFGRISDLLSVAVGSSAKVYVLAEMYSSAASMGNEETRVHESPTASKILHPSDVSGQVFFGLATDNQSSESETQMLSVYRLHTSRFEAAATEMDQQGSLHM